MSVAPNVVICVVEVISHLAIVCRINCVHMSGDVFGCSLIYLVSQVGDYGEVGVIYSISYHFLNSSPSSDIPVLYYNCNSYILCLMSLKFTTVVVHLILFTPLNGDVNVA